jgi:hypothetical protein
MKKGLKKAAVAAGLVVLAGAAMADGSSSGMTLDLSPINDAMKLVTQVGSLCFLVYVGIRGYHWVRQALR